jgi:hypothetical protein
VSVISPEEILDGIVSREKRELLIADVEPDDEFAIKVCLLWM